MIEIKIGLVPKSGSWWVDRDLTFAHELHVSDSDKSFRLSFCHGNRSLVDAIIMKDTPEGQQLEKISSKPKARAPFKKAAIGIILSHLREEQLRTLLDFMYNRGMEDGSEARRQSVLMSLGLSY